MIKQTNSVQAKHAPLLGLFLNGYENMRQQMDAPCRRPLLEIAPLVFGKWYYAALAKENHPFPCQSLCIGFAKGFRCKNRICVYYEYQSGGGAVRFGVHLRISLLPHDLFHPEAPPRGGFAGTHRLLHARSRN